MEFSHISVLLSECIEGLDIKSDGIYVDCTAGGGGHSFEIAKRLSENGRLISIDRDPEAIEAAGERLKAFPNAQVVRANFSEIDSVVKTAGISAVDGVLFDLGVSSHQLDTAERGFSYKADAPLDMRMSKQGLSARDVVNEYEETELARILFEYGEERFSRQIAAAIVKSRQQKPIETTLELAGIISSAVPAAARREKNPAKRSFQAIRIEVNKELDSLSDGLDRAFSVLGKGGRMCVISFHSLEDRLVKQRFASCCRCCICPPDFPASVSHMAPKAKLISKKAILPGGEELIKNSRSKSAKLRILEKL